ncbi:MAG: xanthine dehydrogenase family protein subunit M [Anaerolineales bacterium]|jgi:carbon-monoxide dehydrogenase medium subunit
MKLPLPELPAFDYQRATTAESALESLGLQPARTRVLLGGTDLFVQMRAGSIAPTEIIDLKQIPELATIDFDGEHGLTIGAAASMNSIARHPEVEANFPLLVQALETVASYQLRSRATIGGNLCNASPAADSAPALLVLESHLTLQSADGTRDVALSDFFKGPGESVLKPGEILTQIHIPMPPAGWKGRYLKLGRNTSGDLAIVGVAAVGYPDPATASGFRFRIALASVAPTPLRVYEAEQLLEESELSDASIEAAARRAQSLAKPISDARSSAEYRRAMVYELTAWGLKDVREMLTEEA